MSVTVDLSPLETTKLGVRTLGQVFAHLQKLDRLIVRVLIDGEEPAPQSMPAVRQMPVTTHTIYIETADPRSMASDILSQVDVQLDQADLFKDEAADLLRKNQWAAAMEKLAGCFSVWQTAQQAIIGTAQLLKVDMTSVMIDGAPMQQLVAAFTQQLRQIKEALEARDFVLLTDLLAYETTQTTSQWRGALRQLLAFAAPV